MTTNCQPVRRTDQLQTVQRWDRVQLEAQLEPASRTAQGYLRTHAAVAVPGVMEYVDASGNVTRELVPAEELHNVDSLRSLAGLPVTLQHPDEDVTPDNVGTLGVGALGNDVEILEQSGHVRVLLVLHRRDALQAVDQGMVEVSPGYTTVIDPTPGVHPVYGAYDAVQTRRRYNHLAVVDQARGGPTVKLRADTTDRCATRRCDAADPDTKVRARLRLDATPPDPANPQRGRAMHPFLITLAALCALPYTQRADGKVCRTDMTGEGEAKQITEDQLVAAIADAIRQLQAKAAEADAEPAVAEGEMSPEAMKARIQELEGQLAALQAEKADRDAAAATEAAKADRAHLDGLADRLAFDRTGWTDATTNEQRKLDLAKHRGLLPADAAMQTQGKADGVALPKLDGMISALQSLHPDPDAGTRADAYADLQVPVKPPTKQPARKDGGAGDAPPADPMKAAIAKRNRDRLQPPQAR